MLLYIHIPFCDSKCSYCAFNSYVDKFSHRKNYMDALHAQLLYELERFSVSSENKIESIFIGGGTPSTIEPSLYRDIFSSLEPFLADDIEITSEANPNSATYEWLEGMRALGVNRISFGIQSFNSDKLRHLGRAHNTTHAIECIKNAQKLDFKNISCDFIYGVNGDNQELLKNDIDIAMELKLEHLSLYALSIEPHTDFEHKPSMSSEDLELTKWLFDYVESFGLEQYEISNFGKYRSFHNLGYWRYKDYIGIGSGAVGFLDNCRLYPSTVIEDYIKNPLQISTEELAPDDMISEQIFLALRSCVGIDEMILDRKFLKRAKELANSGILEYKNGRFYNNNYLLSDEIALYIEGY